MQPFPSADSLDLTFVVRDRFLERIESCELWSTGCLSIHEEGVRSCHDDAFGVFFLKLLGVGSSHLANGRTLGTPRPHERGDCHRSN